MEDLAYEVERSTAVTMLDALWSSGTVGLGVNVILNFDCDGTFI